MNTHNKNPELNKFLYNTFLDTEEGEHSLLDDVLDYCNSNNIKKGSEDYEIVEKVFDLYKQGFVRNQDLQFLVEDLEDTKDLNFLLSERQHAVYTMKEKNKSYKEIAETLEITESTARDHYKTSLDKIKKRLEEAEKIKSFLYRNKTTEELIQDDSVMLNYRILEESENPQLSTNGGDYNTAVVFAYLLQNHKFVVYVDPAYKSDFAKQNITILLVTDNPVEARLCFSEYPNESS